MDLLAEKFVDNYEIKILREQVKIQSKTTDTYTAIVKKLRQKTQNFISTNPNKIEVLK